MSIQLVTIGLCLSKLEEFFLCFALNEGKVIPTNLKNVRGYVWVNKFPICVDVTDSKLARLRVKLKNLVIVVIVLKGRVLGVERFRFKYKAHLSRAKSAGSVLDAGVNRPGRCVRTYPSNARARFRFNPESIEMFLKQIVIQHLWYFPLKRQVQRTFGAVNKFEQRGN